MRNLSLSKNTKSFHFHAILLYNAAVFFETIFSNFAWHNLRAALHTIKNERSSSMSKEEKRRKFSEESSDPFYDVMKTASTTECTGLVPSGILDESESEAYGELYSIHPPKAPEDGEEHFIH
jgi:hypothetical protein